MIPILKSVRPNTASWHNPDFFYGTHGRVFDERGMYGYACGIGDQCYVADKLPPGVGLWLILETEHVSHRNGKCVFHVANVAAVHSTIEDAALDIKQRTANWTIPEAAEAIDENLHYNSLWLIDIARTVAISRNAQAAEAERLRRQAERQAERAYWRNYVLVSRPTPDAILVDWPLPEYVERKR